MTLTITHSSSSPGLFHDPRVSRRYVVVSLFVFHHHHHHPLTPSLLLPPAAVVAVTTMFHVVEKIGVAGGADGQLGKLVADAVGGY